MPFLSIFLFSTSYAGEVDIVDAHFSKQGNQWKANVTLKHEDTGWEHYADSWRVLDGQGNIIGTRVLYHPHVDEQPFTRRLSNITIPKGTTTVFIEAHDKEHGSAKKRHKVDLQLINRPTSQTK